MSKQIWNDFVLLHGWYNSSILLSMKFNYCSLEEINCQLFLRNKTRNMYFGLYETPHWTGKRSKALFNRFIILCIGIFILGYDSLCTYSQLHLQALCDRQNSIFTVVFCTVCQMTHTTDVNSTDNQQRMTFRVLWS